MSNWLESDEGKQYEHQYRLMYEHRLADEACGEPRNDDLNWHVTSEEGRNTG